MDLSTSKGADEVTGRIRWDFEEWELFVSLYLSRNPGADLNDPSFQLPKAEFLAIQDVVIREQRHRTAYYDVLKKAVGHMRKAKQRLDDAGKLPLEPDSWTEQHYRDVAAELMRLRPELKLLFSDSPSGYNKNDILNAQLVLPEDLRRSEVDLKSIQEPLWKALAQIRGGATNTSIQLTLHGIGNAPVCTLKNECNEAAEGPVPSDTPLPDDCDCIHALPDNAVTPETSTGERAPSSSLGTISASSRAATPAAQSAPPTSNSNPDVGKPLHSPKEASDYASAQDYREIIDYAAKALGPLAKMFAQELASALALELKPLISAAMSSRDLPAPGSTADTQSRDPDEAAFASPGVSQITEQSKSSCELTSAAANAGDNGAPLYRDDEDDDELDTRLLRTPNLHESRLVESGWDHVAKPTPKSQLRRSESQRVPSAAQNRAYTSTTQSQPVRKMRIGVVGMRARDANELRNDYPNVEFTVVDRGSSDISVSLDQCDRVIGLAGGVPALADGLLKRKLGERYHIAQSGASEIRTTLDGWVTCTNQSLN